MKNRQPTQDELIGRLHRELGATVTLDIHDVPYSTTGLQRRVNATLLRHHPAAEPYQWAEHDPLLTLVWPSLPRDSDLVFVRRFLIRDAGVWPERVNHLWCVPEHLDKQPTPDQLATYLPWLHKALETSGTRWVIPLGSRAVWTWRPDLKPRDTYGKVGVWRDTWYVYPMMHPQEIDNRQATEWGRQWSRLNRLMAEDHLLSSLESQCIKCGSTLYMYDPDGVPWCKAHIQDGLQSHRKAKDSWASLSINAGQQELFPNGN